LELILNGVDGYVPKSRGLSPGSSGRNSVKGEGFSYGMRMSKGLTSVIFFFFFLIFRTLCTMTDRKYENVSELQASLWNPFQNSAPYDLNVAGICCRCGYDKLFWEILHVCCYFHASTPSDVRFLWLLLATKRLAGPGLTLPTLINLGRLLIVSPIVAKSLIAE